MALLRTSILVLMFTFVCTPLVAESLTNATLARLMEISGINAQSAEFPNVIWAGVMQSQSQQPLFSMAELAEAEVNIKKAFDVDFIQDVIRGEIRSSLSEEEAQKVLLWLESDLGRKITDLEKKATTSQGMAQMMSQARMLLADKERVERFKRYDRLVNAVGSSMQIQQKAAIASFSAMANALDPNPRAKIESYKSQVYAQEARMRANAEQITTISFVYSYKNLPLAEIDKYLDFYSKPTTQKYSNSVQRGMRRSLNEGMAKMSKAMALMYVKYRAQPKN